MQVFGLARIGRDVVLRTAGDSVVANVSLAFNRRAKGEKLTDWVDAAIWGKRAEALAPYLLKGGLVSVTLDDVHIEKFQSATGEGHKMVGTITQIELAGGQSSPKPAPAPAPRPAQKRDEFDDDIPF